MVSSLYSDIQNVDLWTNLTKSSFFSTRPVFFLLEHSRYFLTLRKVLGHANRSPRGHGRPLSVPLKLLEVHQGILRQLG